MDAKIASIDLQSMIDTHDLPFVLIDREFRITAVNSAYEQAYGLSREQMVGQMCYQISHHNSKPCFENGEDCPHQSTHSEGAKYSCIHLHYDDKGNAHRVRINAYPVMDSNGETLMGEVIQKLSENEV